MIQRFKPDMSILGEIIMLRVPEGAWVGYTDHLACVAELEGENAKMRSELDRYGKFHQGHVVECLAALEQTLKARTIAFPEQTQTRLMQTVEWLRSIAAKVGESRKHLP